MQPIEFIIAAKLSFIQGNIVKYISRFRNKNGKQDLEKCIQYAQMAIDFNSNGPANAALNHAYCYCKANSFNGLIQNIIIYCTNNDYYAVIKECKKLIKSEYENNCNTCNSLEKSS